jgi:hypothetical protein
MYLTVQVKLRLNISDQRKKNITRGEGGHERAKKVLCTIWTTPNP